MFKNFFKNICTSVKGFITKAKKSKIYKGLKKAVKIVSYGAIVVTAYNLGNITEALSHMSDGPSGFADTARWFIVMCGDFIKDIKAKNFTWEVKRLFTPFVIASSYVIGKITGTVHKIASWFSRANKAMNVPKSEPKKPATEVVNLFA